MALIDQEILTLHGLKLNNRNHKNPESIDELLGGLGGFRRVGQSDLRGILSADPKRKGNTVEVGGAKPPEKPTPILSMRQRSKAIRRWPLHIESDLLWIP